MTARPHARLGVAAAALVILGGCHCEDHPGQGPDAGDGAADARRDAGVDATPDASPDGSTPCDDATEIQLPPTGDTIVGSYWVWGNYAIYSDWRTPGTDYREDLYAFDLVSCEEIPVAVYPDAQMGGRIYDDVVVYSDFRGNNGVEDLFSYDLLTGLEQRLTDTPESELIVGLRGPMIVYLTTVGDGIPSNMSLLLWDRSTDQHVLLADYPGAAEGVSISDRYVSWAAYGTYAKDVYYYDMQTGQTTHVEASGPGQQFYTSTDGDYLFYMTEDASAMHHVDMYRYSTGQATRLQDDGYERMWPIVWKNLLVYHDYRYSGGTYPLSPWDIVIQDLDTGVTRRITKEPSGRHLAVGTFHSGWLGFKLGGSGIYQDILYVWNLYRMGILDSDNHVIPE